MSYANTNLPEYMMGNPSGKITVSQRIHVQVGDTLQQKLDVGQHFSTADAGGIGIRLVKGLGALHCLNIVHRDIKPANLHQGNDGKLRIHSLLANVLLVYLLAIS